MGAWAEDTFGNDTACDWIDTFLSNPRLDVVKEAIQVVIDSEEYLDSDEACVGLAACEVVARLHGNWGVRNAYTEELDKWIEANPISVSNELKESCKTAIDRVLAPNSELLELWDEGGRDECWHQAVDDLRDRLS